MSDSCSPVSWFTHKVRTRGQGWPCRLASVFVGLGLGCQTSTVKSLDGEPGGVDAGPGPSATGNYSSYATEAARCAAEPIRSTGTKHYFCDCKAGADAACQPGSDANDGLSIAAPKQLLAPGSTLFQTMPAGDTILLCKGGAFDGNSTGRFVNGNCRATNTCDVRDYVDTRNGHSDPNKKPIVFSSNTGQAAIFDLSDGDTWTHEEGYRFLNLDLEGGAASPRAFFLQNDVSDVFICNNTINSFTSAVVQNESSCGGRSCPVTPLSNRRLTVRGNLFTNNPAIAFLGSGDSQAVEYNSFDRDGNGSMFNHPFYLNGFTWNGSGQVPQNEVVRGNEFYHSNLVNGVCGATILDGHGQHTNTTIEANIVTQVAGTAGPGCWGISYDTGGYPNAEGFTNLIIRANRVTNVGNQSIGTMMCVNCTIENNLIIQDSGTMGARGIVVPAKSRSGLAAGSLTTTGMMIRNNTIWFNAGNGTGITLNSDGATGTGNVITNNAIVVNGSSSPFNCFSLNQPASSYYVDHNDCYFPNLAVTRWEEINGATLTAWRTFSGLDAFSATGNPLFTNPESDFTTQANSPLRSAGDTGDRHFAPIDILGRPRAMPTDIGAYNH